MTPSRWPVLSLTSGHGDHEAVLFWSFILLLVAFLSCQKTPSGSTGVPVPLGSKLGVEMI